MKKRRILLALIMLIISGISLTTATYAWFTANSKVTVEEMNVQATSSGGIQISANAKDWSNKVSVNDLKNAGGNILPEDKDEVKSLMPLTTIGTNTNTGTFDFYLGTLDDAGGKVNLTKEDETTSKNMLAFDLYFYSATAQTVFFDKTTSVGVDDDNLQYAMRVGFLYQGNESDADVDKALALKGGTSANQIIWEPYANKHTNYAVKQLGAPEDGVQDTLGGKQATATGDYVDLPTTENAYFSKVTTVQTNEGVSYPDSTKVKWTFPAGINKMRVYVWIEGQDIDCEDTASLGSGLTISLAFTIKDPSEEVE